MGGHSVVPDRWHQTTTYFMLSQPTTTTRQLATSLRSLLDYYQEYISIESVQLPETAFLHIDVTSSSANPISGGVVV